MIVFPLDSGLRPLPDPPELVAPGDECARQRRCRRIEAFHHRVRPAVSQLTAGRVRREDLADSFPGLLFAIASGFGASRSRELALSLVDDGAGLREVAAALGLPLWLRRLPAAAFAAQLPAFSLDPAIGQRMAALAPVEAAPARIWLDAVITAWRGCSEDFALWVASWIARQQRFVMLPFAERNLLLLAAWAWHADQPETLAHRLLRRPWTPSIGHRRALDEVVVWRQRIDLALVLSSRQRDQDAPLPGHALGYEFRALESAEDFIAEADIMDNCLDQFADRLATRFSRVYSVRRGGRVVANVEIGSHDEEVSMPAIRQLRAVRNRRAPAEVWQATYAWLGAQPVRTIPAFASRSDTAAVRGEARRLWEPYLAAMQGRWPADEFRAFSSAMIRSDVERTESFTRAAYPVRPRRPSNGPTRAA